MSSWTPINRWGPGIDTNGSIFSGIRRTPNRRHGRTGGRLNPTDADPNNSLFDPLAIALDELFTSVQAGYRNKGGVTLNPQNDLANAISALEGAWFNNRGQQDRQFGDRQISDFRATYQPGIDTEDFELDPDFPGQNSTTLIAQGVNSWLAPRTNARRTGRARGRKRRRPRK